jgi:exosortase
MSQQPSTPSATASTRRHDVYAGPVPGAGRPQQQPPSGAPPGGAGRGAAALLLGALVLWSAWPAAQVLVRRWTFDPQYSHGYIVPLFSLFLLWRKRAALRAVPFRPDWAGVAFLAAAAALRLAGNYAFFPWFTDFALLPAAAGVALLCGGWPMLRQCAVPILFLGFMLPLPYGLQIAMATRLQAVATAVSAYLLEVAGFPVLVQGNQILLTPDRPLLVQDACNGLSMVLTFLALCAGAAVLVRRPWLDKAILLLSAVPIAVAVNVLRITATGVLLMTVGEGVGKAVYHDFAGLLMMPMAVLLILAELFVLGRLFPPAAPAARTAPAEAAPPAGSGRRAAQPRPVLPPG